MVSTVWRFIYTKYRGILYAEHCGKIYLHKILRNTLCWTLLEDLFTQNADEYFILKTVGRFIYTKYWGILYAEHCGKIYLPKILRNTLCWTLWEDVLTQNTEEYFMLNTVGIFIYTKYWGLLYVEHCGKMYLQKILGITLYWTLWEDLFTQNTEEYCMLSTGKIHLHKILGTTLCWALWENLFTQNTGDYFMLNTVGRFIYTHYWGLLYVEHCGKIYLHKILGITLCWTLWEDLFTQNIWDYFLLNSMGIFIYIKYLEILYVEHCGNIYLRKILRNTLCWALWEDLFIQNTEEYCMLNTRKIYLHKILYVEHCEKISLLKILRNTVRWTEKIYLHKILRNTVWRALCEDLFTQNTEEYFVEHCGKIYLHKIPGILYAEHCGKIYLHKILRNTLCWTLLEDLFTQNTEEYFILKTVGRFIYTKYWGILYAEHCGKIYLHKILRNTVCWTLRIFIYTKYWGILYVEHCEIYLHKILGITLCWTLWEDLFTQNTKEYCMLNTVGRFIYTKYWWLP